MTKLIRAGIKRMLKMRLLYVCFAIILFIDGFDMVKEYLTAETKASLPSADGYLMSGFLAIVILSAVFISSFIGSEHSFGTIRNKMTVGHKRLEIYFASFVVCEIGVMLMYALVWLLTGAIGTLLLGWFTYSTTDLLNRLIASLLAFTMLTALNVMIAFCIHSKSKSSVTAVIAAFIMMISSVMTIQILSEPEFYSTETMTEETIQLFEPSDDDPSLVKNPNYVSGTKRRMYQIIHDYCPVTQMIDVLDKFGTKDVLIPSCEIIVLMAAGMVIFKKRDLK